MQVEFLLSQKDLFRMLRHIHTGQYPYRNVFFYGLSVFCLLFAIYNLTSPTGDVRLFFGIAVLPLFYMVVMPMALLFRSKGMWNKEEYFQKKFKYKLDEEGIHVNSGAGKGLVKWGTLKKVFQTKEDFVFYVARAQAFIIPIRALDDFKKEKIRDLLTEHVPEKQLNI